MNQVKTVSLAAVESRVRRALRRQGEALRKTRPGTTWMKCDYGDYYTIDASNRYVVCRHVCLDTLARELLVMHATEVVEASYAVGGGE